MTKAQTATLTRSSGATGLAHQLRKELLALKQDEFYGYEDELLDRFNVSRPTLRQAARVMEHEQLLRVRRGPRGGYYVTRPEVQSVINAASLYLYDRGTRLRDLMFAAHGCVATLVRCAAQSCDEEAAAELRAKLDAYAATDFARLPHIEFLRAENRLFALLGQMGGNAPLELIVQMLYGCGLRVTTDKIFEGHPDRIEACAQLRVRIIEAVLAHDADLADLLNTRVTELRRSYLEEDEQCLARSGDISPAANTTALDFSRF